MNERNRVLGIYLYKDKKVDGYDIPFICINDVNAKRKMIIDARNKSTVIHQFPEEFDLIKAGTFDSHTGYFEIITLDTIMTGFELKDLLKKENE